MKRLVNATVAILVLVSAVLAYQEADLERGIERKENSVHLQG